MTCIWPCGCHCHSLSLASVKSRLVIPFWYQLTRVVPDKGLLNGCVHACMRVITLYICMGGNYLFLEVEMRNKLRDCVCMFAVGSECDCLC